MLAKPYATVAMQRRAPGAATDCLNLLVDCAIDEGALRYLLLLAESSDPEVRREGG